MEGYTSKIVKSSKEFSARERLKIKDTSNAIKLDQACTEGVLTITPIAYAEVAIHNENSQDKDYPNYVIIAEDGKMYVTGSSNFFSTFEEIWEEMTDDSDELFAIDIFKKASKNYAGKSFITCSVH